MTLTNLSTQAQAVVDYTYGGDTAPILKLFAKNCNLAAASLRNEIRENTGACYSFDTVIEALAYLSNHSNP
jgi:hypothetical protein